MNTLDYLLSQLGDAAEHVQLKHSSIPVPATIILLDGKTAVKPRSICIGRAADVMNTVKNFSIPKETLFFLFGSENGSRHSLPGLNVVETTLDIITLYNKLNTAMSALKKESPQNDSSQTSFDRFFRNVISRELSGAEEIRARMRGLDNYIDRHFNIIVIEPQNAASFSTSYEAARAALLQILPASNITSYANRLVAMYHHADKLLRFPEDLRNRLQAFLEEYDALAGISNQTKNIEMIRTEYIIAANILNIGKKMRPDPDCRIFLQEEEYGVYYILNLCYKQFEQTFHHRDILYLTHPGLAAIIRYDQSHRTNLREILLCYLLNDRSLTKTSKLLFMHRNTIMNKINKITEIIEDNLEDSYIRQRLLFSCMLYDYCEQYCYKPFRISADLTENE